MNILIFPVILTCISLTDGNNWIPRHRYTKKYLRRYFPVRRLTCIPGYEGANCATQCFNCQSYRELQNKVTYLENNRPVIIPDNNGGSGTKGQMGEKGDRGDRGFTGQKGNQGVLGFTGLKGDTGGKGDKGDTGDTGLKGERGLKGESGTGNNDVVGLPGQKGEPGIHGPSGPPGINGPKGDEGQSGINGLPGKKGEPGMNGLNGFPGTNGPDGLPGPRGLPGSDGERGYPGIPGSPGLKGSTGEPGFDGQPGISGVPGAKGETGETTTIVIPNEEITILKEKIKDLENTVTSCCDEVKELNIVVTGILKSLTTTTTTETVTPPESTTTPLPLTTPLTGCEPSEFKCFGADRCIPSEFRCDGIGDCDDESDEIGCECNRFQFTCVSDQRCIPLDKKCNNEFNCKDMSDEVGCEERAGCPEGLFTCANRNCIRQALKCNGVDDCGDESDEMLDECDNVNETDKSAALKRTGCNSIDCSDPPSYPFNIPGCKTINCSLPPPPVPPIEHPLRDDVMNIISSSDCKDDALSIFGLQREHGVSINSQLKDDRSLMKMFISGNDATSMGISQTIMSGTLVSKILKFGLICVCIIYSVDGVY